MNPSMTITYGDCEMSAKCANCGTPFGPFLTPDKSLDLLAQSWERHAMLACKAAAA